MPHGSFKKKKNIFYFESAMGEVFSLASEPSSLYVLIFEFLHTHTHTHAHAHARTHTHKCGTDSLEQLVVILFYISFVV